jgi:hypothetical protein
MTGLPPSVHGSSHPAHPWLRPDVSTLAQDLAAAGFATRAFHASPWSGPGFGLERGFESSRPLHRRAAERWLAAPPAGPSFTWVELAAPGSTATTAPAGEEEAVETAGVDAAVRQKNAAPRRDRAALRRSDAAPPPPPRAPMGHRHDDLEAAYRLRVAEADRRFGRLLDALQSSGRWEEAIVVVLADHGETIAAGVAVPPGRDLGRASIEVPLAIHVPAALRPGLSAPAGATVGLDRVRATVVELAGLRPAPALAPSLLRPSPWAALSELWLGNGYHEVALYEDGHQLRWRCRFAAADPDFDDAWREALSADGGAAYGEVVARLDAAQRARPGCSGGEEVVLEAWPPGAPPAPLDDAARSRRMLERLRNLRRFPPAFLSVPAPAPPALRHSDFFSLAGWGLPLPRQWLSTAARGRKAH